MAFLASLNLPAWLTQFNMDYVVAGLVVFALLRALFSNYRARLRFFLWFTIPFALILGLLFVDAATLPFLQDAVNLTGQTWIGTISSTVVDFVLGLYQQFAAPLVAQLPLGIPNYLADLSLVYLAIAIGFALVLAIFFSLIGSLFDRPGRKVHDDDKPKSFTATPLISLIIAILSNALAVYTFYLVFSLLNNTLGMDVTTNQYLFPLLNQYDPILDKLIAVVTAATAG